MIKKLFKLFVKKTKVELYRYCSDSRLVIEEYIPKVHPKHRTIDIDNYVSINFPGWAVSSHS